MHVRRPPPRGLYSAAQPLHPDLTLQSLMQPNGSVHAQDSSATPRQQRNGVGPHTGGSRKRTSPGVVNNDGASKRQRCSPQRSRQAISVDTDEDELSQGGTRRPPHVSSQQSQGHRLSNDSLSQSLRTNALQVAEYKSVEDRLCSKAYSQANSRRSHQSRHPGQSAPSLESRDSDVQVVSEKQVPHVEARNTKSATDKRIQRETANVMPGSFPEESIDEVEDEPRSDPKPAGDRLPPPSEKSKTPTRSDGFAAPDDESPDELAEGVRPRTLEPSMAKASNTQAPSAMEKQHNGAGLRSSTTKKMRSPAIDNVHGDEAPRYPAFLSKFPGVVRAYIRAIIYEGGYFDEKDFGDIGLVVNRQGMVGLATEREKPQDILDLRKVIKIDYHKVPGASQLIVHLRTSQIGTRDTNVFLEFGDCTGYMSFIETVIRVSQVQPNTRSSDFLLKAFRKRYQQVAEAVDPLKDKNRDETDHGPALPGSKQVHEENMAQEEYVINQSTSKRQRSDGPRDSQMTRRHSASQRAPHGPGSIDDLLQDLRNSPRDANLIDQLSRGTSRRQTRSSTSYSHPNSTGDALTSFREAPDLPPRSRMEKGKPWRHPLVYPPEGKRKATVIFEDLDRLDDDQFLNDNLIDFYLKYLLYMQEQESPEIAKNVYLFNTFFFEKLTSTERGQRINYDAVKRWTRGIDLFSHDFVVVPINESAHWYLAIICNLPALKRSMPMLDDEKQDQGGKDRTDQEMVDVYIEEDDEVVKIPSPADLDELKATSKLDFDDARQLPNGLPSPIATFDTLLDGKEPQKYDEVEGQRARKSLGGRGPSSSPSSSRKKRPPTHRVDPNDPAIITLDSLGQTHSVTIRALKDYLVAEAAEKRGGMTVNPKDIKGLTAKDIPQQKNYSDCGVYVLGYMDKFMENPRAFTTKMLQREFDEEEDWPKLVPGQMRQNVLQLLQSCYEAQEGKKREKKKMAPLARASDLQPHEMPPIEPQGKPEVHPQNRLPHKEGQQSKHEMEQSKISCGEVDEVAESPTEDAALVNGVIDKLEDSPRVPIHDGESALPIEDRRLRENRNDPEVVPMASIQHPVEPQHEATQPLEEVQMVDADANTFEAGIEAEQPPTGPARASSNEKDLAREEHEIQVPDSQESSFLAQLHDAAAKPETSHLVSAECIDVSQDRLSPPRTARVQSSPPRPKTRGKPSVIPGAELPPISPPRRSPARRREPAASKEVVEVDD